MSSITKRFVDTSSFVYQAVLHVLLRDFTNYYWYKELEQQQSPSLPETQDIKKSDEVLDNEPFKTEESNCKTRELIDVNSSIGEKQINEECSHETGDKYYSKNEHFNTPTRLNTEECVNGNLGDCIQKDDLGSNYSKETFCGKNKTSDISDNEDNRYFGSDLSESPDELKGTSLKQNLSYIVVAQKSDGDSLTYKILNNENYLGETTVANPASTSGGTLKKKNAIKENLIPQANNKYESLNDLTVCFKDCVSIDTPKTPFGDSPNVSESTSVDEGMTELRQKSEIPELNHSIIQNPTINSQHEKCAALKTNSTESLLIKTGTVETKSCEETFPTDSIWNIEIVQEKIQNLLSALTSNVGEKSPDENIEPVQKLSDTSYDDSDDGSDNESYDELVKKVFRSGPKSVGEVSQAEESCCTCLTEQGCLQVVEFDEAEELLTGGQMSSVDTGSVSDWLYSVTPAICLPSTSFSTIKSSGKQLRIHEQNILTRGKHSKYQDEIISRTLFTDKWVDDTKKYCKP